MLRILSIVLLALVLSATHLGAPGSEAAAVSAKPSAAKTRAAEDSRATLDEFNRKFIGNCRNMDQPAAAQLWADDGADLLPGLEPMVGKPAIAKWLNSLTPQLAGAKMLQCDVDWRQIKIDGDMAYEWGINTQRIAFPGKPDAPANVGKILLILRRQPDGSWKVVLESWNSTPRPAEKQD